MTDYAKEPQPAATTPSAREKLDLIRTAWSEFTAAAQESIAGHWIGVQHVLTTRSICALEHDRTHTALIALKAAIEGDT